MHQRLCSCWIPGCAVTPTVLWQRHHCLALISCSFQLLVNLPLTQRPSVASPNLYVFPPGGSTLAGPLTCFIRRQRPDQQSSIHPCLLYTLAQAFQIATSYIRNFSTPSSDLQWCTFIISLNSTLSQVKSRHSAAWSCLLSTLCLLRQNYSGWSRWFDLISFIWTPHLNCPITITVYLIPLVFQISSHFHGLDILCYKMHTRLLKYQLKAYLIIILIAFTFISS